MTSHVKLPVIRKDFIIDAYQIYESRVMGADCILLIASCLDDAQMKDMEQLAHSLDMAVLVEVHDEAEMARAAALGAEIIGINNRDLKSLTTDLSVTEQLAPLAPPGALARSTSHRAAPPGAVAAVVASAAAGAAPRST